MGTVYERNGVFYAQYSINKKQFRHTLGTSDREFALKKLDALVHRRRADSVPLPEYYPKDAKGEWPSLLEQGALSNGWLSSMYRRTKDRSLSRGVNFKLTKDHLMLIATRSDGYCELTGSKFSWVKPAGAMFPPMAPSLDRIIPRDGYCVTNCRLVCYAANVAMGDWGENVMFELMWNFFETRGWSMSRKAS